VGRVLFEITPVPAVMRHQRASISGLATCRVELIEPADNAFGADFPNSVRNLRKTSIAAGGSLRSKPPEQLMATAAEAVVPSDLLASLPDAALLAFRWGFTPDVSAGSGRESR
jgi:hypothetical protein